MTEDPTDKLKALLSKRPERDEQSSRAAADNALRHASATAQFPAAKLKLALALNLFHPILAAENMSVVLQSTDERPNSFEVDRYILRGASREAACEFAFLRDGHVVARISTEMSQSGPTRADFLVAEERWYQE
jgi:hypothetical protein